MKQDQVNGMSRRDALQRGAHAMPAAMPKHLRDRHSPDTAP
jgi:hypothetical protein